MLELIQDQFFFRCPFCSSVFGSARDAELCCKQAKAQIVCEKLRQCNEGEVWQNGYASNRL